MLQVIPTFLWDIAEGICILVRGGHRGIHPGAIVGVDLVIWLGWIVVLFFLGDWGYVTDPGLLIGSSSYSSSQTTNQDALAEEILGKGRAMMAFGSLTL